MRSVAVPIHDPRRAVAAAINLSAHAARVTVDELKRRFLPLLREAAERIEIVLPGRM